MVLVMVNPGRRVRDKINQRDAVGGDLVEVRDVERKVLMHRGVVCDPPPRQADSNEPPVRLSQMPGEQALDARTNAAKDAAPEPVAAPEAPVESTPAPAPAPLQAELEEVEKSTDAELTEAAEAEGDAAEDAGAQPEAPADPNSPQAIKGRYKRRQMRAES